MSVAVLLKHLGRSCDGVAAIEFGLTLPILLMASVGAFDVSRMIAMRIDYQQAVTETASLAIAQPPRSSNLDYLKKAGSDAAGVPLSKVTVNRELRCNNVVTSASTCPSTADERAWYVSITINGTFMPSWSHFAIKQDMPLSVSRTVRVQ